MNKYFKAPQNQEELEKIAIEIDEEIRAEEEEALYNERVADDDWLVFDDIANMTEEEENEMLRQCYEATDWDKVGHTVTFEY